MEHLTHFNGGSNLFLDNRFEHAFHGKLNLANSIVNNGIKTYLDTLLISLFLGKNTRANLETDNDCLRSSSERNIIL